MTARMREHPDVEQLFAVVHGLADAKERTLVLDHVRGCARCEAEFRALDRTREAARGDLPAAGTVSVAARPGRASRFAGPRRVWTAAAAVAAVVALIIMLPNLQDRTAAPPVHWLPATVEAATVRSDAAAVPPALAEALAVYGRHDAGAAIPALEELRVDAGWASLRDLYLLSALTNAGRFAAAETVLVRLDAATLPYGPRHAARWYQYVLLARTGRQAEARSLLVDLEGIEGEIGDLARAERRRLGAGAQGKP